MAIVQLGSVNLRRAERVITKTYKLTYFTENFAAVWTNQIDCKKLIASRTNRIVMPLRSCVTRCLLDKSDCVGVETCYVFHYAAVLSSDTFGTAVSILRTTKDLAEKFRCNNSVRHN